MYKHFFFLNFPLLCIVSPKSLQASGLALPQEGEGEECDVGDEPDSGPIPAGEGFVFEYEVVSITPTAQAPTPAPALPGIDFTPAPAAK